MLLSELKQKAKIQGLKGFSTMKKAELAQALGISIEPKARLPPKVKVVRRVKGALERDDSKNIINALNAEIARMTRQEAEAERASHEASLTARLHAPPTSDLGYTTTKAGAKAFRTREPKSIRGGGLGDTGDSVQPPEDEHQSAHLGDATTRDEVEVPRFEVPAIPKSKPPPVSYSQSGGELNYRDGVTPDEPKVSVEPKQDYVITADPEVSRLSASIPQVGFDPIENKAVDKANHSTEPYGNAFDTVIHDRRPLPTSAPFAPVYSSGVQYFSSANVETTNPLSTGFSGMDLTDNREGGRQNRYTEVGIGAGVPTWPLGRGSMKPTSGGSGAVDSRSAGVLAMRRSQGYF